MQINKQFKISYVSGISFPCNNIKTKAMQDSYFFALGTDFQRSYWEDAIHLIIGQQLFQKRCKTSLSFSVYMAMGCHFLEIYILYFNII